MKFSSIKYALLISISTLAFFSCSNENDAPAISPVVAWEGEYITNTENYGEMFSPLVIDAGGNVSIAGVPVDFQFDVSTNLIIVSDVKVNGFTFSGEISFEQYGDNVIFEGEIIAQGFTVFEYKGATNPIALWDGDYTTETQWWGSYFSPLKIEKDGTVSIAGTEIDYTYDHSNAQLTFDWHDIKTTKAKGTINLNGINSEKFFSGSINPRPQDGPVGFAGVEF